MFSWRSRRQFIVLLAIAMMIGIVSLFSVPGILPEPTCFDDRKNQGEVQTDCGGPCQPCELKHPKEIVKVWTRAVNLGEGIYDVAAQIQNPNEVLSAPILEYEFVLYDDLGEIGRTTGNTFLFAQESIFIADVVRVEDDRKRIPTAVAFDIINIDWQLRNDERPNLLLETYEYKIVKENDQEYSTIQGSIANRTNFHFREVEVIVFALDREGNLLGSGRLLLDQVRPESSRPIKGIWPIVFREEPSKVEIQIRTNILDPLNIVKPFDE